MCEHQIILIDIDDTIIDTLGAWINYLNEKYNCTVTKEDVKCWDMSKTYTTLTKEQIYEPFSIADFWKTVKPKQRAAEYIKKLIDDGYRIYLCTSTHFANMQAKYEYAIQKYFPYIDWKDIILTEHKTLVKADYRIDDNSSYLIDGSGCKLLMAAPHNKNIAFDVFGMLRVNNWEEIYDIISNDNPNKQYKIYKRNENGDYKKANLLISELLKGKSKTFIQLGNVKFYCYGVILTSEVKNYLRIWADKATHNIYTVFCDADGTLIIF